jgi:putative SOS response-associated peptidase YedK
MCGRYTLTTEEQLVEDLEATLDPAVERNEWWKPRFNIAPTQDAPVVRLRDGARVLEMMRWGLVPFWAGKPGAKRAPLMINARVESIDTKQVFRDALGRKRCLVPADGFFEWKRPRVTDARGAARSAAARAKQSQPLWIHPAPHRFVAFAGLYARAGELHSFTIITGPANELVAPIHDRMPVVLDRSAWAAWLDPSLDAAGAHALLGVPPPRVMADWRAEPVSKWVNSADHDDARCIEPEAPPAQKSLFE